MKNVLSASICAIALAAAIPAFAADDAKPMHHKHHMMKGSGMMGPHTKMKPKGDPSTEQLNAKSLEAARGGSSDATAPAPGGAMAPAGGAMAPAAPMAPAGGAMAPAGGAMAPAAPMAPPSSGTNAMTTPSNAPGGQ